MIKQIFSPLTLTLAVTMLFLGLVGLAVQVISAIFQLPIKQLYCLHPLLIVPAYLLILLYPYTKNEPKI
jgi:hypothetical protein